MSAGGPFDHVVRSRLRDGRAPADLDGVACLLVGDAEGALAAELRGGLEGAGARVATAPGAASRERAERDVAAAVAELGGLTALVTVPPVPALAGGAAVAPAGIGGPAVAPAGIGGPAVAPAGIGELAPGIFDAALAAGFRGPFLHTQAALPHLRAAGGSGRLVYVASALATTALPGTAHVAAAERAVVALMRTAALEGGPEVTANAVLAGPMRGGTLLAARARALGLDEQAAAEGMAAAMPARRLTEPRDVLECVAWLLRPASDHVSGRVLTAAGGAELHG